MTFENLCSHNLFVIYVVHSQFWKMKRKKQRERKRKKIFDARDHKEGIYGFAKCHPNIPVMGLYYCAYV
jgi:hypothetical protein